MCFVFKDIDAKLELGLANFAPFFRRSRIRNSGKAGIINFFGALGELVSSIIRSAQQNRGSQVTHTELLDSP